MDVSFYIGELLKQHGEISVPGLGYLVLARVSGYYNEAEGKFYPPHHLVQFDLQQIDDDDTLTQHIADVKNISLASSKYFTEKYINTIKEESLVREVPLANLGWFYTDQGKLTFRAADITDNDPAFFGFASIKITKLGQEPVSDQPAYVPESIFSTELPINDELPISDEPYTASIPPETVDEEDEFRRSKTWLIVLILLIVLVVAAFGVYRYSPNTVTNAKVWVQNILHPVKPVAKAVIKPTTDTIKAVVPAIGDTTGKRDTVKTDTVKKTTAKDKQVTENKVVTKPATPVIVESKPSAIKVDKPKDDKKQADIYPKPTITANRVIDKRITVTPVEAEAKKIKTTNTTTQPAVTNIPAGAHWAVVAIVCQTRAKADAVVSQYKQNGLNAFILSVRGSVIKVAAGGYATNDEADSARAQLVESKKIPKDAYLQEIKSNR